MGLEDFETMERIFSFSNALASIVRYASPYRRRIFIDFFLRQWDDDKYLNSGTFILNNYTQALKILDEDVRALEDAKVSLNFTDEDMDQWEQEQKVFFGSLGKEPEATTLRVEYVELLQALQAAEVVRGGSNSSLYSHIGEFVMETPSTTQAEYSQAASTTMRLETTRRLAHERYEKALQDVVEMEVRLQVHRRWVSSDPEYVEMLKYIAERRYHRATDKLHQLMVQRLFELHKLNVSGTGKSRNTIELQEGSH